MMRISPLCCCILIALAPVPPCVYASDDIQFNTEVLDIKDRENIDLRQFARAGYVMPGDYTLAVRVNTRSLLETNITFLSPEDDPKGSVPCLTPDLVRQFGFKDGVESTFHWWHNGQCLDTRDEALKGMDVRGDLATSALNVSIPQAYLEYTSANWDPPARWDDGIPGILMDYNLSGQKTVGSGTNTSSLSGNGTVGANLGAWRLRADWQGSRTQSSDPTRQQWQWSRYYLYRPVRSLRAKLVMGEDYLESALFDSPRFAGIRLISDDNQLPPNLRGYAPEVTGVARTNAKVIISQQGRVLYQSLVAPGPFRIQSLNSATSGELDVTVQEQDGTEQKFQVNTATVPYLSRPGMVRYKLAAGRPSDIRHRVNGPLFTTGEFSWGVNNGWSLYGGAILGSNYNAISSGVGRDLLMLGAVSFDASVSRAQLSRQGTTTGNSYRLSYSKKFDSLDSQVTFAGYRFSDRAYMSLSEFLDARLLGEKTGGSKQMYTVSFNKQFKSLGLSSYFNMSRQTYWDGTPASIRYSASLAKSFDIGRYKNISLALSAYRNQYLGTWDRGGYLSLSVPFGENGTLSYTGTRSGSDTQQSVGYFANIDAHNSYQVSAGSGSTGVTGSGSFVHEGDSAEVSASASYQEGRYSSAGMSVRGGVTATQQGVAMHRISQSGGTRLMLGTDGVGGVPVHGYGSTTTTNQFGVAVISDINSYYHNEASIDLNHLADDVDVLQSVTAATLTEGAIGWRHFDVLSGKKAVVVIGLPQGGTVPFGAIVTNSKGQQTGLAGDGGSTWLTGMNPDEKMDVSWNGDVQCVITLPTKLDGASLLLPCVPKTGVPKSNQPAETLSAR